MTGELFINGVDAYTYGVSMGKGFISALEAPLTFKDNIENDSTLQHGKRVVLSEYLSSREVSLTFTVQGADKAAFEANKAAFLNVLYGRKMTIRIKGDNNYYRLLYLGKSTTYGRSFNGCFCYYTAKFEEINPHDRAAQQEGNLFVI